MIIELTKEEMDVIDAVLEDMDEIDRTYLKDFVEDTKENREEIALTEKHREMMRNIRKKLVRQ